jgi:hypothetical protein
MRTRDRRHRPRAAFAVVAAALLRERDVEEGTGFGAALIVRAQAGSTLGAAVRGRRGWLGVAVTAGAVLPVQGAVNPSCAETSTRR